MDIWYLEKTTSALLRMAVTDAEEQLTLWPPLEVSFEDL